MIKEPDVLSENTIRATALELEIDTGDTKGLTIKLLEVQRDADAEYYEPLIKEMYEALRYANEQLEKHIYKDADVIEFGGSKLSVQREIVKVLAKVDKG